MDNEDLQPARDSISQMLVYCLLGSTTPLLRAVTLKVTKLELDRYVHLRFIVDETQPDAANEILDDVAEHLGSVIPLEECTSFDHSIDVIPEPGIVALNSGEILVFHRWEPGLKKTIEPDREIRDATAPLPSPAEVSTVIQRMIHGSYTRPQAAAWARYWTGADWFPRDQENATNRALISIADADRSAPKQAIDGIFPPLRTDDHYRQLANSIEESP